MTGDSLADLLVAFGLALLLGALVRYILRRRTRGGRAVGLALAALATLSALGLGELAARWAGVPRYVGLALVGTPLDPELGWRGDFVNGDPASARPRALVIGDSTTDGSGVPRAERYYASLSRDLGYEVWAFSAPGWGTLQEYLVLDREVDRVKPQLIEWQTCANDFWNNDWELERGNYALNNLSVRPYLEDGQVVYRPSAPLVPLRRFLAERSSLASWLNGRFQRFLFALEARGWLVGCRVHIRKQGLTYPPFARAVATTEDLARRIVARAAGRPLVVVPTDDTLQPYTQAWTAILDRQGVPVVREGLASVRAARERGEAVIGPDGAHWNARGHALVGAALARWVAEHVPPGGADER